MGLSCAVMLFMGMAVIVRMIVSVVMRMCIAMRRRMMAMRLVMVMSACLRVFMGRLPVRLVIIWGDVRMAAATMRVMVIWVRGLPGRQGGA